MAETITSYLCAQDQSGGPQYINVDSLKNVTDIDSDANEITTKIVQNPVPALCEYPSRNGFEILLKPDPEPIPCFPPCGPYSSPDANFISWDRGEESVYPIISLTFPDNCQLIFALLVFTGHPDNTPSGDIEQITLFEGGPIPENKSDVHGGGFTSQVEQLQNTVVPGFKIQIEHVFSNGVVMDVRVPDFEYWCTPCFFGGKITGINGPDDETRTYDVEVFSNTPPTTRIAKRLDFIDWQTGDWVFLVPFPISSNCQDKNRPRGSKGGCSDSATQYIIVPLKIGAFGD